MTANGKLYNYRFNLGHDPLAANVAEFLWKNSGSDVSIWDGFGSSVDNMGVSYSRSGMLSIQRAQDNTSSIWSGDPRFLFGSAVAPSTSTPSLWQQIFG